LLCKNYFIVVFSHYLFFGFIIRINKFASLNSIVLFCKVLYCSKLNEKTCMLCTNVCGCNQNVSDYRILVRFIHTSVYIRLTVTGSWRKVEYKSRSGIRAAAAVIQWQPVRCYKHLPRRLLQCTTSAICRHWNAYALFRFIWCRPILHDSITL